MRREARRLLGDAQGDVEAAQAAGAEFVARLRRLGILSEEDEISAVLSLDVTDLLERRLQTVVYRQGFANTPAQARQFISHGHITVGDARVRRPSKKVEVAEENLVGFDETSPLSDDLHPERAEAQE
jgi:small subunit ribosomal protein S4